MTSSPSTRSNRDGVAVALAQAARVIDGTDTLDETLDAIVRAAQATIPSFEHVGISVVHDDGRIETRAGTGALVRELDDLQVELCEGPCYDAMDGKVLMVLEDARDDARWPRYLPLAARKGLRAQMGLQLFSEDGTLGGLNFYSTRPGVSADSVQLGELFATHASIALGKKRTEHQLNEAVASRQSIGTAVGILMERYRLPEDQAFRFLVRASNTSNTRLRDLAQEIVDGCNVDFARDPG